MAKLGSRVGMWEFALCTRAGVQAQRTSVEFPADRPAGRHMQEGRCAADVERAEGLASAIYDMVILSLEEGSH